MPGPGGRSAVVAGLLRRRADRGVFRSFAAVRVRGRLDCSFVWLKERPVRLIYDEKRDTLEFRDLLPNVAGDSKLYQDLQAFLKGWTDGSLPPHRAFDQARLHLRRRNRRGSISILVDSLDGDLEYAVSKGLQLVNEIFMGFLRGPYFEYMAENFQEPED